jgi:hypothetical protein
LWLQNTIFYLLKKLILILTAFGVWNLSINWCVTCFTIFMHVRIKKLVLVVTASTATSA